MVIGGVALVFAALVLVQALSLDLIQRSNIPGPGFFPTVLAIAIGILGVLLFVSRFFGAADQFGAADLPSLGEMRRSMTVWLAILAAGLLLDVAGFVLTSAVLIATLLFGVERLRSIGAWLTVFFVPLVFYIVFVVLLQVRLPAGPWGF